MQHLLGTLYGTVSANLLFSLNFTFKITLKIEIYFVLDGEEVDFLGMVKTLGTAIIMTPLIAILECIALSKAFGKIEHP